MPVPSATHVKGLSAIKMGIVNSSSKTSAKPFKREPPPVKIMPFSTISADNSGGVNSKTSFVSLIILFTLSFKASFISSCVISIVEGKPVTKFLPLTSLFSFLFILYI